MLELTIKTLDSQNHFFTVPDDTTVAQLKLYISVKLELPVENQRLIFHGKVLQDDKKLTEYGDVSGKVIHLVQRAPPSTSRPASQSTANDQPSGRFNGGTQTPRIASYWGRGAGPFDGSNATYLGAMAFPADLMDAQGMTQPPPSQGLSRSRLNVAGRMLSRAENAIAVLEGNSEATPGDDSPTDASGSSDVGAEITIGGNIFQDSSEIVIGQPSGSILQAAQATTAAAIAAAVSAAHSAGVPSVTIMRAPNNATEIMNPNIDVSSLINNDHPENVVAVEVEVGTNQEEPQETSGNNTTNEPANASNTARTRLRPERTSAFATLLDRIDNSQTRFQPLLRRCHQLMVQDPSFTESSSPNAEECQRLFNGVSETMHHLSHAYHALSDIMVDFNEDTPRSLRCRPVLIQHSAILETGFPIQVEAQINLSRRPATTDIPATNTTESNAASNDNRPVIRVEPYDMNNLMSTDGIAVGRGSFSHRGGGAVRTPPEATGDTEPAPPADSTTDDTLPPPPPPPLPPPPLVGGRSFPNLDRLFQSVSGGGSNPNVEFFMDFGPEGVTLGSFETTVLRGRSSGGNGQGPTQVTRPPPGLLQAVQAVAGQIQDQLLNRVNRSNNTEPNTTSSPSATAAPTTTTTSATFHTLSTGTTENTATTTTSSTSTGATASTGTTASAPTSRPATASNATGSRPYVQLGPALHGIAASSYDPFLPCNSHHIRSPRRTRIRATNDETNNNIEPNVNIEAMQANQLANSISQLFGTSRVNINRLPSRRGRAFRGRQQQQQQQQPTDTPDESNASGTSRGGLGTAAPSDEANIIIDQFNLGDLLNMGAAAAGGNMSDLLSNMMGYTYIEGQSIVGDFLMSMARHVSFPDLIALTMARRNITTENLLNRLRPHLSEFVHQRLLQGETPNETNISNASDRLFSEMQPYFEAIHDVRLRENVDLESTISNFNQLLLPDIIKLIVEPTPNANFGQILTQKTRSYFQQLVALIIYCCQDGNQGFDSFVQNCVRLLTRDVTEELQQWTEENCVGHLRSYVAGLNVPNEEIQRFVVYRPITNTTTTNDTAEPMETEPAVIEKIWPDSIPSPSKDDEEVTLAAMDTENLPDVLLGSEAWHNSLPSDWVPIIARDSQRQRKQSAQKPFSDAYVGGMPPKRRKIIASAKPQGNLSTVVSETLRHAITTSGVNSPISERVISEAGRSNNLQDAYKHQERVVVSADLKTNPDFIPSTFPNAFKYFDKSN